LVRPLFSPFFLRLRGHVRILKAPLAGGSPITLATSVSEVFSLVVDDTSVYFTDFSGGNVVKVTPK
jgi:hypothetical protein